MIKLSRSRIGPFSLDGPGSSQSGLSLVEFLISAVVLLIVSAAVFSMLSELQRTASYQTEVQAVLNNVQAAMQVLERCVRQAGNDPRHTGLTGIELVSSSEVHIHSDLTGSAGNPNPDKGDPDGDIDDSGENLTIRYNSASRSIEIVPDGSSAQIIAGFISELNLECFDAGGNVTHAGQDVRTIKAIIKGSSTLPDPQTHRRFGMQLSSDILVLT
jgi:type II secretory pathway pseudopilin PulG